MVRAQRLGPDPVEVARLRGLDEDRARAELDAADLEPDRVSVRWSGEPLARTLFVKGVPSSADGSAGSAMAGPDGEAARKVAAALGIDREGVAFTCSRPDGAADAGRRAERLGLQIEALDPAVVIATDGEAAADVTTAMRTDALAFGTPVRKDGRVYLAVDGFEACLDDESHKRRVWAQLRPLGVAGDEGPA